MSYTLREKFKNSLPRLRTTFIIIAVLFLLSDFSGIYGGMCLSSPCSALNDSGIHREDHFIYLHSFPFLAPTAIFIPTFLKRNDSLTVETYVRPLLVSGEFDNKNEDNLTEAQLANLDRRILISYFFLIKLIILLNIPIWLLMIALIKRYWGSRSFREIIFLAITVILIYTMSVRLAESIDGETKTTAEFIFGT